MTWEEHFFVGVVGALWFLVLIGLIFMALGNPGAINMVVGVGILAVPLTLIWAWPQKK